MENLTVIFSGLIIGIVFLIVVFKIYSNNIGGPIKNAFFLSKKTSYKVEHNTTYYTVLYDLTKRKYILIQGIRMEDKHDSGIRPKDILVLRKDRSGLYLRKVGTMEN